MAMPLPNNRPQSNRPTPEQHPDCASTDTGTLPSRLNLMGNYSNGGELLVVHPTAGTRTVPLSGPEWSVTAILLVQAIDSQKDHPKTPFSSRAVLQDLLRTKAKRAYKNASSVATLVHRLRKRILNPEQPWDEGAMHIEPETWVRTLIETKRNHGYRTGLPKAFVSVRFLPQTGKVVRRSVLRSEPAKKQLLKSSTALASRT